MVGGMGHSLSVSLGYSLSKNCEVICLDGDGSILMHLGSMRTGGIFGNKNLKHIILNNFEHESVGGQRTYAENMQFTKIGKSLGYKNVFIIKNIKQLKLNFKKFLKLNGPSLIEVLIKSGSLNKLKRPRNFIKIKKNFMN